MDVNLIKELVGIVNGSTLTKFEIEDNGLKIRIENIAGTHSCVKTKEQPVNEQQFLFVKSPMVGTFKLSLADSCIKIGDKIAVGTPVCAIEAMKLINTVTSEVEGEVVEILAKDGDTVEYGQNLIKLK